MKVFLSPHNDDETLFGAFTLLRNKPHVIVCLRSFMQEQRGTGITWAKREAETAAAMEILGCTWEQWEIPDSAPDWNEVMRRFSALPSNAEVWCPCAELGGHAQHNAIGDLGRANWPNAVQYMTYTNRGKSSGREVPFELWMVERKLAALACYSSQILEPSCCEHFVRDQREYLL